MPSKSRSLTFAVVALLVLFGTGLLLFRSFLVEEKIEEVVVDTLRSIFGDAINIGSVTTSDVLKQVELRAIEISDVPGSPFSRMTIDRIVIGGSSRGIAWIKISGGALSLAVDDTIFQRTYSDNFLGSILTGASGRRLKRFPMVYLENCSFDINCSNLPDGFSDIKVEDVDGRITSREQYLIAYLNGLDGTDRTGSVQATIAVDVTTKAAEVNMNVDNGSLRRYGRYLKNAPYIDYHDGRFNLEGAIGWRPRGWQSTGKVILRDGIITFEKVGKLTGFSGPILFENSAGHRKRKLDGVTFTTQGVPCRIVKGMEVDREVNLHLVPGRSFFTRLEHEAKNRSLPLKISLPSRTSINIAGKMPDVVITGSSYLSALDFYGWSLKDVSLSYEIDEQRLSFDDAQASFLGGQIRFSGGIGCTGEHPFSLALQAKGLMFDIVPEALSPLVENELSGEIFLEGNLKRPDRIVCTSTVRLSEQASVSFRGTMDCVSATVGAGSSVQFENCPLFDLVSGQTQVFDGALAGSCWDGTGTLHGSFSTPVFEGEVTGGAMGTGFVSVDHTRAWVVTSGTDWTVKKVELELHRIGGIIFNGELSREAARGTISGEKLDVSFLPGVSAQARFEASVSGNPGSLILDGALGVDDIQWKGLDIGSLKMDLHMDEGELALAVPDQEIAVRLPEGGGFWSGADLRGTVRGTLGLGVTRGERGTLRAALEGIACNLAGVQVDNLVVHGRSTDDGWHLDQVRATVGLGTVDITGDIRENGGLDLKIDCISLSAGALGNLLGSDYEMTGSIDAAVMVEGTIGSPVVSVAMEMDSLETSGFWRADEIIFIAFIKEKRVFIEQSMVRLGDRVIKLSGTYPLSAADETIDLRLSLEPGSLSFISQLFPLMERVEGSGAIDLTLTGDVSNPIFDGFIDLDDIFLQGKDWQDPLTGVDLSVSVTENEVDVNGSLSSSSRLPLAVRGKLDLHQLLSPRIELEFSLRETHIELAELLPRDIKLPLSLEGKAGAHLVFSGEPGNIMLSGDIRFTESRINMPFGSEIKLLELPWPWLEVDVDIIIGDRVSLQGNLFSFDVEGNLEAEGRDGVLLIDGRLGVHRGEITYLNNKFEVLSGDIRLVSLQESQSTELFPSFQEFRLPSVGVVLRTRDDHSYRYTGNPHVLRAQNYTEESRNKCLNCDVDLQAQTDLQGVTVTMQVSGKVGAFNTRFYSSPQMPEEKIMTLLSTEGLRQGDSGGSWVRSEPGILKFVETGLKSSLWSGFGNSIAESLDLNQFDISTASEERGLLGDPSIQLGKYLDDDLYVTYEHSFTLTGGRSLGLEYRLEKRLTLDGAIRTLPTEDDLRIGVKFRRLF